MKKILIMEGNSQFAQQLAQHFTKAGYEVCGVTDDGEEGLQLLEKTSPDCAIVSLMLRSVDGFAVLEHARGCGANIIALGGYADDAIIQRTIQLGARYYLMKPIRPDLVQARLEQVGAELPGACVERKRAISLDERISSIFISIGIPPNIKGYGYLREAIKMTVEDTRIINHVTKELYPVIGEKFETSASKVERAIRHAIEVAWNRGRTDAINAIFGPRVYIGTEKPTNSEFIALVADKLILEDMT